MSVLSRNGFIGGSCPHQCFCSCHRGPGIAKHIVACCNRCTCGRNIKIRLTDEHKNVCHKGDEDEK